MKGEIPRVLGIAILALIVMLVLVLLFIFSKEQSDTYLFIALRNWARG